MTAIVDQAEDDLVTLHVSEIAPEALNETQQAVLPETADNALFVEITLHSGNKIISDFRGGCAEIRLPYVPRPGEDTGTITVWHIAQDGTLEELPCRYENGVVIFTVWHFSEYLIKPGVLVPDTSSPAAPVSEPSEGQTPTAEPRDPNTQRSGENGNPAPSPETESFAERMRTSRCMFRRWLSQRSVAWYRPAPAIMLLLTVFLLWLIRRKRRYI